MNPRGSYQVPETNLFSDGPIVPKQNDLKRISRRAIHSGYSNPYANNDSYQDNSNSYQKNIRQSHNHSANNVNKQRHREYRTPETNKEVIKLSKSTNQREEIRRMKSDSFMEAKSVLFVFDEILENATEIDDLESKLY